jgi:sirohydrochlorin cobaltochelatase
MSTGGEALILLGHGARDPGWATPLHRIKARICAAAPGTKVELAFLEFMEPTLEAAMAALVAADCPRIHVLPVFLAQGGHLKRELPARIESLRRAHPRCELALAAAAGEDPGVIAAIASCALARLTPEGAAGKR